MALVAPQQVTLYQAGDLPQGSTFHSIPTFEILLTKLVKGASFNNLLDALDASYCTFEGGDDPTQDGQCYRFLVLFWHVYAYIIVLPRHLSRSTSRRLQRT